MSALPQCEGEQWVVDRPDELAHLVALILVGQDFHAALILEGTQLGAPKITANLKAALEKDLHPTTNTGIEHRDGLLFEIICWGNGAQRKDRQRKNRQFASKVDQSGDRRREGDGRPRDQDADESHHLRI